MSESSYTGNRADMWGIASIVAFAIGVFCLFYGFFLSNSNPMLVCAIAGGFFVACFWIGIHAQFLHLRSGVQRTNELLEFMASTRSNPSAEKSQTNAPEKVA